MPGFSGAVAADRAGGVLELTGWGSRTFKGYWTAPPLIVIGGTGASTRLDFTAAQLISPTVTIEFRSNYGGAAEFVVPKGSVVRVEGLQMRGGHINNKVPPARGTGPMTLVLTGVKKSGSVTVRHPGRECSRTGCDAADVGRRLDVTATPVVQSGGRPDVRPGVRSPRVGSRPPASR